MDAGCVHLPGFVLQMTSENAGNFLEWIAHRLSSAINTDAGVINWKECLEVVAAIERSVAATAQASEGPSKLHDPSEIVVRLGLPNLAIARMLFLLLSTPAGYCSKEDLCRFANCGLSTVPVYVSRLRTFLDEMGLKGELKPYYKMGYSLSEKARERILAVLAPSEAGSDHSGQSPRKAVRS